MQDNKDVFVQKLKLRLQGVHLFNPIFEIFRPGQKQLTENLPKTTNPYNKMVKILIIVRL